ncbi:MAG: hypothetical protein H7X94_10250, partial [Vallitaleaceae bacterium]|nr:hypothetical protein [Vallitaleaceae bacterium]
FTLEELSKYNGKDGMAAYVAISGTVYDVSAIPEWNNGDHNGYEAGVDATEIIKKSPHGLKVVEKLPIVGTLE